MSLKICIIDDDIVSQFATQYCIEQYPQNTSISTYADAEESLSAFFNCIKNNEELPDIIFLDLVMGDINGWQFIESLKQMTQGRKFPEVYVLSGFTNAKDRTIAKSHADVSGYFDKPLTRNSLNSVFPEKPNVSNKR